jgi:hypothetical protein
MPSLHEGDSAEFDDNPWSGFVSPNATDVRLDVVGSLLISDQGQTEC